MYKISSSESSNEKATDFETKAMLYLMNYYQEADRIHYFVIDFFNDISGVTQLADACFDVQSKGIKNIQPTQLGEYLVTLFKNYISEFNFEGYLLFVEGVSATISSQLNGKNLFSCFDLDADTISKIKNGLINAANYKTYIEDKQAINDANINSFLEKVLFVINYRKKEDYIRDAVQFESSLIIEDRDLRKIFKEIRDKQSSKKNNRAEGELLSSIGCFAKYDKFLKKEDIQQLIMNRICFKQAIRSIESIPKSFLPCIQQIDETIVEEVLEDCQNSLFRLLYDKNNKIAYWALFEEIVMAIKNYPQASINEIYERIDRQKILAVRYLDILSCKYYISLIKERIK